MAVFEFSLKIYNKTNKGYSRGCISSIRRCIYFWKLLIQTSSMVYVTPAPIEAKGQNQGDKNY